MLNKEVSKLSPAVFSMLNEQFRMLSGKSQQMNREKHYWISASPSVADSSPGLMSSAC